MSKIAVSLQETIGKGYKQFWNFTGRYRVVKGSRSSKKSKTSALWYIYWIMYFASIGLFPNVLVVRKTYRSLQDSCFMDLKWAIHRLHVDHLWKIKTSPLEISYIPTGQKILFRGLDDPLGITSITVENGVLCWLWIEEAYEISKEEDFDILDESIRGITPGGLFKQITLTFNPWNEHHWIKHRFFDELSGYDAEGKPIYKERNKPVSDDGEILAITTNYLINEWLDESDLKLFERMKKNNPRRYQVAGLGNWGIVEGLIYENWIEKAFSLDEVKGLKRINGLDFGYTNDPSALFDGFLDTNKRQIYVYDEMYKTGMSNAAIAQEVGSMGLLKERIIADSAEPKSIDELRSLGLRRIKGAKKGKDSILNGIQWIQDYQIIIHPRCVNFITEISNYTWQEDKFGKKVNVPIDDFNHLMDAMRYAVEDDIIKNRMEFSNRRIL